jgi:hypothetical protein
MGKEPLVFNRKFVVAWLLGVMVIIAFEMATYGHTWRFNYNASITGLATCSGLDTVSRSPIPVTHPITVEAKEITVCGHLEGIGPIPLEVVWEYNGEALANKGDYYQPGYMEVQLMSSKGFKAGKYSVSVYEGRSKLASTEFAVEQP